MRLLFNLFYLNSCTNVVVSGEDYGRDDDGDKNICLYRKVCGATARG